MSSPLIVAQAAAEYGAMSAVATGVRSAWYRLEVWVGTGNGPYAIGAAVVLLLVLLFWRRR
jgi:uncharacterized protein (TIGR03382 family)